MGAEVTGRRAYAGLTVGVVAAGAGTHAGHRRGGCAGHVPFEDPWRRRLVEHFAEPIEFLILVEFNLIQLV